MKIRKAYQGTVPENKILDTYSESQTDTYSCNYVNGDVLYNNTTGTTGTVNLSSSASNYKYIEIFFKQSQYTNNFNSVKVYSPNGKTASLTSIQADNNAFGIYSSYVSISGTTITKSNYGVYWTNGGYTHTDYIYITRVVGYK